MVTISFLFLGVALCALIAAVSSLREQRQAANINTVAWATPAGNYVVHESMLSWCRTAVFCAALCLMGIVFQAGPAELAFASRIWTGVRQLHRLPLPSFHSPLPETSFDPLRK
jgi:hypothetical protein